MATYLTEWPGFCDGCNDLQSMHPTTVVLQARADPGRDGSGPLLRHREGEPEGVKRGEKDTMVVPSKFEDDD
jgi:hypothetical protein